MLIIPFLNSLKSVLFNFNYSNWSKLYSLSLKVSVTSLVGETSVMFQNTGALDALESVMFSWLSQNISISCFIYFNLLFLNSSFWHISSMLKLDKSGIFVYFCTTTILNWTFSIIFSTFLSSTFNLSWTLSLKIKHSDVLDIKS